jgi:hypothetical protein
MIEPKPESPEEVRKRLREMSDVELRRFGQRAGQTIKPKDELRRDRAACHGTRRGEGRMSQTAP